MGLPSSTPHPILVLRSPALLKPSTQFIMALRNIDDAVVGNEVIRFTSLIIPRVNGKADVTDNEYNGYRYETITAETDEGVGCVIKKSLYDRAKAAGLVTTDEWESEIDAEGEVRGGNVHLDMFPAYNAKAAQQEADDKLAKVKALQEEAKNPKVKNDVATKKRGVK